MIATYNPQSPVVTFASIDPGVNGSAVAYWLNGTLLSVIPGVTPTNTSYPHLVIEKPQVYQGRKQKGDPNDLIDLALVVGRWWERHISTEFVKPRQWKGQVPKPIMKKRVLAALTGDEKAILGNLHKDHNVVDAVGIGLWKLGRL